MPGTPRKARAPGRGALRSRPPRFAAFIKAGIGTDAKPIEAADIIRLER
jgi:hypothetical protein